MNLNTTETMKKASTVLGPEVDYTVKNMKKMMAKLGETTYKTVKCRIVKTMGSGDDVATAQINSVKFSFKRGESYDIPEHVAEVLERYGDI